MASLLRDRHFAGFALAGGLAFGAMFTYIAGSPFVLQEIYGASPQAFSAVFAVNSVGIVAFGQLNGRLAGRVEPLTMLRIGVTAMAVAGCALFAVVAIGSLPLAALLVPLWVLVASMGLVFPNTTALALAGHPEVAGSASALLGVLQFVIGARGRAAGRDRGHGHRGPDGRDDGRADAALARRAATQRSGSLSRSSRSSSPKIGCMCPSSSTGHCSTGRSQASSRSLPSGSER